MGYPLHKTVPAQDSMSPQLRFELARKKYEVIKSIADSNAILAKSNEKLLEAMKVPLFSIVGVEVREMSHVAFTDKVDIGQYIPAFAEAPDDDGKDEDED